MIELTWVHPGEIDGEPDEVRQRVVNQLQMASDSVGALVLESIVQIRGAGITGLPGHDEDTTTLDSWMVSEEGDACRDLVRATKAFVGAVRELQRLG